MEGKLGLSVLDLVQSKIGLSRPLGAHEPVYHQRSPVTPGSSWNSLALLSPVFLHSHLFHTVPQLSLNIWGLSPVEEGILGLATWQPVWDMPSGDCSYSLTI